MPIDKDMYMIFETYARPATPNKVNHNHPSTVADVKKSTAATAGAGLDIKGQGSDIGFAGNTPVDVSETEEDAETVEGTTPTPVKGRYIYFVDDDELYQLKPYKQIQPTGMMMAMSNNWTKETVMQGEDVRNIVGMEVKDPSSWYIVKGAPSDHAFVAYIGA